MSALFEVGGVQSRGFGERGVARYLIELAGALERWFPESVERYLINPNMPVARALELLPPAHRIGTTEDIISTASRVYHVGSPFEPDVSLAGLWPPAVRPLPLAVTLYDLIPELFPETYLADPQVRTWYRTRLELLRRADRILAISRSTAADAIERLGLRPDRVVVVGAAAASRFAPPTSRQAALAEVRATMPEIQDGFLLYTGGIEPRKNIDRLLAAYSRLPRELRDEHQLVIVCRILPDQKERLERTLHGLGVADRVHFTNYVTDDQLVSLYGATTLFVFPSLYEGYGLPVAEAVACSAAVIASNTSSLVELVVEERARFDPYDIDSIGSTIAGCLTEPALLEHLRRPASYALDSWRDVGERTVAVYEELAAQPRVRRRARSRPRIAYVSPLPPQRSGVADYSYRLLERLSGYCDIDAFVDRSLGEHQGPPGVRVGAIAHFEIFEQLRGGYDQVLICLGNSEHHPAALNLLRRRGGVVLAHDIRLVGMYTYASLHRRELESRALPEILRDMYEGRIPAEVGQSGSIALEDVDAHHIFMAREAIAAADRFAVHSEYAGHLARSDAAQADRHKVCVMPFAFPDSGEFSSFGNPAAGSILGTFGMVAPVKQTEKVIDAFSVVARDRADCELVVAGPPAGAGDYERLREQVSRHGLTDRVRLLGHLDGEAFRRAVSQTTVAVQLRAMSMGESPASVGDCLAAGVPTVVTALGSARELPDEAVVKVPQDIRADVLAETLLALLDDMPRRASLGAAAQALARERSFEHAARFLYDEFVLTRRAGGRAAA